MTSTLKWVPERVMVVMSGIIRFGRHCGQLGIVGRQRQGGGEVRAGWLREKKLTVREDILDGPEAAMGAIGMLYRGESTGELIVRV